MPVHSKKFHSYARVLYDSLDFEITDWYTLRKKIKDKIVCSKRSRNSIIGLVYRLRKARHLEKYKKIRASKIEKIKKVRNKITYG